MRPKAIQRMVKIGLSLVLAAAVLLLWPAAPAGAFTIPHGPYIQNPDACASCHSGHAASGINLLVQPTTTGVCFTCHDGTGSMYNIQNDFSAGGDNSVFHPVQDTGNPGINGSVQCTDCHNPHGDKQPPEYMMVYPRLLRSSDGSTQYYQGPAFCNACHGSADRNFTGPADTYWEDTLGDHTNNSAAHYDTSNAILLPGSGTLVTCALCHDRHASSNQHLLAGVEESLCQTCHLNGGAHNTTRFTKTGSVHNVDGAGGSKLECTGCHGPHTVNSAASVGCSQCHNVHGGSMFIPYKMEGAASVLSDPDNTKKGMSGLAGTGLSGLPNSVGDLSDFCLRCHDGSPPTETYTTGTLVPYTVLFPLASFTTSSGGWNKNGYKDNGHATSASAVKCGDCHESHGSDYPALQRYAEDTGAASGECLRCHDGSAAGAANVKNDFTKSRRHPALDVAGKHSNTEAYDNMLLADRHAECTDCHDPHQNTGATAGAPLKSGAITGVSGVSVGFGSSSWSNWPGDAGFSLKLGIDYQYELCLKCHSYYSFGASPPAAPSGGTETDQAREFNPNNPAYHAVVGTSKVPSGYGKFVSPWAYNSPMYCADCHKSDTSGVAGPHGSINNYLLWAPWNPDTSQAGATGKTGADTSGHLCFQCHDYTFYAGGGTDATSKFSSTRTTNLHARSGHRAGCASCHGAVPHGYFRRGMLVTTSDGLPYSTGVKLTSVSIPAAGDWRKINCSTVGGCH